MSHLAIVRHGQSIWNAQDRFTGEVDVPLTAQGELEARRAGERLRATNVAWDLAYTSVLARTVDTAAIALEAAGLDVPVIRDAALNERNYGDLQGLGKAETAERLGEQLVAAWRRSYDVPPPGGESLADTADRTLPFFRRAVMGDVERGRDVVVFAHRHSGRSMVVELDGSLPEQVVDVELGTGAVVLYDLTIAGSVRSKRTWA